MSWADRALNEATEGLADSGGVDNPLARQLGVPSGLATTGANILFDGATVGDCRGDWRADPESISSRLANVGGSSGVVGKVSGTGWLSSVLLEERFVATGEGGRMSSSSGML